MKASHIIAFLISLGIGGEMSQTSAHVRYKAIELPSPPGLPQSHVAAINNVGQIVGFCFPATPQPKGPKTVSTGVCWHRDQIISLGKDIIVSDINDQGGIVGQRLTGPRALAYGVIRPDGFVKLKIDAGVSAPFLFSISESGQMAGFYGGASTIPCLFRNGKIRTLRMPLGWSWGSADAINAQGDAVGSAASGPSMSKGNEESVLWKGGHFRVIGVLAGCNGSKPKAINKSGEVVGISWKDSNIGYTLLVPYAWRDGEMRSLDSRLGTKRLSCQPNSINDAGTIVGAVRLGPNDNHACVWDQGVLIDLNDLTALSPGIVLSNGVAINNSGQIICDARIDGEWRAFLLTPRHY